jgi:hypothetical protein
MQKQFPILMSDRHRREVPECPRTIPWDFVASHDAQAQRNHGGQTLVRLAERGGLCPIELRAVVEDREYPWNDPRPSIDKLREAVEWLKEQLAGKPVA